MFGKKVQSTKKKLRFGLLFAGMTILLSACSIPIPLGNLLTELGSNKSGTFEIPNISKSGFDIAPFLGESKSQNLVGPTVGQTSITLDGLDLDGLNPVIDLTGRDEIQSKLVSIGMTYKFLLTKVGGYTATDVSLQPYIAPADGTQVSDAANALGAPITVGFDNNGTQIIEATVNLTSSQIKAINERKLRLGFSLAGTVSDFTTPIAGLNYDIQSLKITDLKVDLDESFPAGNNGDVISIANIDTKGLTVKSLSLDYSATIKQSTPTVLLGTATVELYLAGASETNLYSAGNLIKSLQVDLAGQPGVISGQLTIQNPLVATVLADDKVRYGVKIKGTAIGIEAVAGDETSVIFEYEVTTLTGNAGVGL